jgi:acetolactate synthase regulatory subunit
MSRVSTVPRPAAEAAVEPPPTVHPTVCFAISAQPGPAVLPRVLEPFAKRGLVPARWHAVCAAAGDELVIDIQIAGLEPALVDLIAASLRQIVGVESVLTAEKRYALSA